MGLTCSCPEYEGEGWFYTSPDDFTKLETEKRKRCTSCKELISIGSTILKFKRWRTPKDDIEERIYGSEEVPLADAYMCEKCGDQYFNLEALGFCINIEENMFDLLEEYKKEYGKPEKAA